MIRPQEPTLVLIAAVSFAVFDRLFITSSLFTFLPVKINVSLYDPQILQGLNYSNCIDIMLVAQSLLPIFYCVWADALTSLSLDELLCLFFLLFFVSNTQPCWWGLMVGMCIFILTAKREWEGGDGSQFEIKIISKWILISLTGPWG